MEWPPLSPSLNQIKNLWSLAKMKLHEGGKAGQWEVIKTT